MSRRAAVAAAMAATATATAGRPGRGSSISCSRSSVSPSISLMYGDSRTFATRTVVVSACRCDRNDFRAVYFRLSRECVECASLCH